LKHHKVYGDQVALLGQSKGVDIAMGVASLFPELISVAITNSGHLMSPIVLPLAKGSDVIPACLKMSDLFNPENMQFLMENELINFDENGMVRTPHGQWRWYHHDMKFLFEKNEENWIMNYDTAQRMKNEGYDLSKIKKIVHCQTLEDPTHSPTAEEAKKLIEFQLDGIDADVSYIKAGHLCILPTIPMIHESFVLYDKLKTVMNWGRISDKDEKLEESYECSKLYDNILFSLRKYM